MSSRGEIEEDSHRETGGECVGAERNKTANEAFLKDREDYPPKKKKNLPGLPPAKRASLERTKMI